MKTNERTKPSKSVIRWIASEIIAIELDMIPPTISPAIKAKEIIMTIMSLV